MSTVIADLIKTIINVKAPVTLFAFLSVVLLLAFKTKAVPELFFGVVKEKLTRERFAQLLHRFLTYGFVAFLALCVIAIVGQSLDTYSAVKSGNAGAVKAELAKMSVSNEERDRAQQAYEKAIALMQTEKFDDAVTALKASIEEVPTITARMTLAELLDRLGRPTEAKSVADQAASTAHDRGSSIDVVRADMLSASLSKETVAAATKASAAGVNPMITATTPLPPGGDSLVTARPLNPGIYVGATSAKDPAVRAFYRVALPQKRQRFLLTFRLPDTNACDMFLRLHTDDGRNAAERHQWYESALDGAGIDAPPGNFVYFSVQGCIKGTVYNVQVQ